MVEGECVNMQFDLIINYRILLQSLRASSLPEGAFYAHPRRQFSLVGTLWRCRSHRVLCTLGLRYASTSTPLRFAQDDTDTRTLPQSLRFALTAVRSRSGSDSHLGCHSIPSRRFATSRREPWLLLNGATNRCRIDNELSARMREKNQNERKQIPVILSK